MAQVDLHEVALQGTATVPVFLTSGGSQMDEDRLFLGLGANYTDTFAILAGRYDEGAGTVTVSWSFTPVE